MKCIPFYFNYFELWQLAHKYLSRLIILGKRDWNIKFLFVFVTLLANKCKLKGYLQIYCNTLNSDVILYLSKFVIIGCF